MRQEGESRKLISTSRVEEPKVYAFFEEDRQPESVVSGWLTEPAAVNVSREFFNEYTSFLRTRH